MLLKPEPRLFRRGDQRTEGEVVGEPDTRNGLGQGRAGEKEKGKRKKEWVETHWERGVEIVNDPAVVGIDQ
jgi:hypothetical protein